MHYSVLLSESIEGLNIQENGIYVDGTLGYGGHSEEILKRLTNGHLYAFDNDIEAIEYSRKRLDKYKDKVTFIHSNFENLKEKLEEVNVSTIDGIVLDLGFSSPQIDDPNRGFSFMKDARLDMRMDKSQKISAYEVVNEYKEEKLTEIFYKYAEEKFSRVIAKNIVARRPIESTMELVDVIKSSVPTSNFYGGFAGSMYFCAFTDFLFVYKAVKETIGRGEPFKCPVFRTSEKILYRFLKAI